MNNLFIPLSLVDHLDLRNPLSYWLFLIVTSGCILLLIEKKRSNKGFPVFLWKTLLLLSYLSVLYFLWMVHKHQIWNIDTRNPYWRDFFIVGGYCALANICWMLIIKKRVRYNIVAPFSDFLESICMIGCTVFFWGILFDITGFEMFVKDVYIWIMGPFDWRITFVGTMVAAIAVPIILEIIFIYVIFPLSFSGGRFYLPIAQALLLITVFVDSFSALGEYTRNAGYIGKFFIYIVNIVAYGRMLVYSYDYVRMHKCPKCHSIRYGGIKAFKRGPIRYSISERSGTRVDYDEGNSYLTKTETTIWSRIITYYRTYIYTCHCNKCGTTWEETVWSEIGSESNPTKKEVKTTEYRW